MQELCPSYPGYLVSNSINNIKIHRKAFSFLINIMLFSTPPVLLQDITSENLISPDESDTDVRRTLVLVKTFSFYLVLCELLNLMGVCLLVVFVLF